MQGGGDDDDDDGGGGCCCGAAGTTTDDDDDKGGYTIASVLLECTRYRNGGSSRGGNAAVSFLMMPPPLLPPLLLLLSPPRSFDEKVLVAWQVQIRGSLWWIFSFREEKDERLGRERLFSRSSREACTRTSETDGWGEEACGRRVGEEAGGLAWLEEGGRRPTPDDDDGDEKPRGVKDVAEAEREGDCAAANGWGYDIVRAKSAPRRLPVSLAACRIRLSLLFAALPCSRAHFWLFCHQLSFDWQPLAPRLRKFTPV